MSTKKNMSTITANEEEEQEISFMVKLLLEQEVVAGPSKKKKLVDVKQLYINKDKHDFHSQWYKLHPKYVWDPLKGIWQDIMNPETVILRRRRRPRKRKVDHADDVYEEVERKRRALSLHLHRQRIRNRIARANAETVKACVKKIVDYLEIQEMKRRVQYMIGVEKEMKAMLDEENEADMLKMLTE